MNFHSDKPMEVKWIKISTDIFDNRKIRQIEKLPNGVGDSLIVIWFKLIVLAGRVNDAGCIYLTPDIPYTEEMLAIEFGKDIELIKLALNTFVKFGMISIENDILMLSGWEKYQNVDGLEKIRKQTRARVSRYRESQKLPNRVKMQKCNVTSNVTGNVTVTQCNATDIDIEEDIDIELDNMNSSYVYSKSSASSSNTISKKDIDYALDSWNSLERYGVSPVVRLTSTSKRYKNLKARLTEYGLDDYDNAIEEIRQSDFLKGKSNKFVITFDWFVRPNNFPKVLEGNYRNREQNGTNDMNIWG